MNQSQLVKEFYNGATSGASSGGANLKIDNDKLIHYEKVILQRYRDKFILNMSRYSVITGRIQKYIQELIPKEELIIVTKVEMGYEGDLSIYIK